MLDKLITVERASQVWRCLNGIFCIYKPTGLSFAKLRHIIAGNLARDLNAMEPEPAPDLVVLESPEAESENFTVTTVPDLRRHPLITGPGYQPGDMFIKVGRGNLKEMAGVTLAAIGSGCVVFDRITLRNQVCTYHIQGKFGLRTDNYLETGRVIEKTTFNHVTRGLMERFLQIYQGQFQRIIPQAYGVDPNSQEAYELHAGGLARPGDVSVPLLYRSFLVNFNPPYFTLEVHCVNETDKFLIKILNDISEDLKSAAVCTKIRRVRWGAFTLDHALLKKHWNAENIVHSISHCGPAVERELEMLNDPWIKKDEQKERDDKFREKWERWREPGSVTSNVISPPLINLLESKNSLS